MNNYEIGMMTSICLMLAIVFHEELAEFHSQQMVQAWHIIHEITFYLVVLIFSIYAVKAIRLVVSYQE